MLIYASPSNDLFGWKPAFSEAAFNLPKLKIFNDSKEESQILPTDEKDKHAGELFLYLAQEGYINELKLLSATLFPDKNIWSQQDKSGNTAMHLAIIQESRFGFGIHLSTTCYFNTNCKQCGPYAISTRCYLGDVKFMKKLLEAFPEEKLWTQQDKIGQTALHLAVIYNHDSVLELACQHQAVSINLAGNDSRTPFLEAAYHGNVKFMRRLLEAFPKENLWAQQNKDG